MIVKTIDFENFNGQQEKKQFHFNLSKGELVEIQLNAISEETDSLQDKIQKIIDTRNGREIIKLTKEIVDMSYGEKSADGTRFIKEDDEGRLLVRRFKTTNAYSELIFELSTNADVLADFIKGLLPTNLTAAVDKEVNASLAARQASEAKLQGFQQKQEPSIQVTPEFQAEAPVYGGDDLPPVPETVVPMSPRVLTHAQIASMSQEELQTALREGATVG